MPVRARCVKPSQPTCLSGTSVVLCLSDSLKVLRVHTASVTALMIYVKLSGKRTDEKDVAQSVRVLRGYAPLEAELSVSFAILGS